jgi:hypothetical protein
MRMPHTPEEEKELKKAPTPEEVIDKAIQNEDWVSAFSNAVSYFEHWGYWKLSWYCIEEDIHVERKIENISISNLTLILYLLKLIDTNTFSKMQKTINERNKLVHPILRGQGVNYKDTKNRDRAVEILEDAKYCINKLKEGVGKHSKRTNQTGNLT